MAEPSALAVFGARVRELRKARRLTQEQLGRLIERDNTTIAHIESGRKGPALAVAVWLGTQLRARSRPQGRRETAPRRAAAPSGEGGEVAVLGEVDQAGLHGSLQRHSVPARRFARPRDSPGRMV